MEEKPYPYTGPAEDIQPDAQAGVYTADPPQEGLLAAQPQNSANPEVIVFEQKRHFKDYLKPISVSALIVFVIAAGVWAIITRNQQKTWLKAGEFGTVSIPITGLSTASKTAGNDPTLQVNGQLEVNGSIVLKPISQPTNPVTGQLFFDKATSQLSYFNGQNFIKIGEAAAGAAGQGNAAVQTTQPGVQLQTTTPGVQQTGNFNVSGTGQVGTLKTTVINSSGGTLYINPIGTPSQPDVTPGQAATLGLTTIGANTTAPVSLSGVFIATRVSTESVGGTANSITVYIAGGSSSRHIQVALYEDDGGLPSRPNILLATSASTNIKPDAYNTVTIPTTALAANTNYWLAFNTDDTTISRPYDGEARASCFYGLGFGYMPDPFGGCYFSNERYTMYLNYITGSSISGGGTSAHIAISGTGQAVFQNSTDSTTAFQVQNASGTNTLLNIDTLNSRIAIGKATANYKLDIASGDINLSNGRSLRFGGLPVVTASASGTIISNLSAQAGVTIQGYNFAVKDADGYHTNLLIDNNGAAVFSNRVNSATGFQIQNATGTTLLSADTSNLGIHVGSSSGSSVPVLLYLANKNTSGDPIGSEGAIYYNSSLASFRCYYSSAWHNCADIEPQHNFSMYDEFLGGQTSFSGNIGSLDWTAAAIGANGSLALNPATPAPSASRPGVLRLRTPASANQGTTLMLGDTTGGSLLLATSMDAKTAVGVSATSGQVLRVGLHDETTTTTQPLSGVWWEADPGASNYWRYCYGDHTTATCANSSVAIDANAWVTLEIRIIATGAGTSNAYFVINNNPYQVSATTIDTTNLVSPALTCYSTDGSAHDCYWDYYHLTGAIDIMR